MARKQKVKKGGKRAKRTNVPQQFVPEARKGTEPMVKWVRDMLDSKALNIWPEWAKMTADLSPAKLEKFREDFKERVGEMTFDEVSHLIETLKFLPKIGATTNGGTLNGARFRVEYEVMVDDSGREKRRGRILLKEGGRVLGGSYGLKTKKNENFVNDITFFRVWIGDRGGWNVQMFVSDDLRRVELNYDTKMWVLKKIAKNPEKASARFGHEFKRCGICGRGLTKDESRARGIGPVCAERL
jgi:hypothetical protein